MPLIIDLQHIIDTLKEGILEKDWECVIRVYVLLSGEALEIEPAPPETPSDLAYIISRLSQLEKAVSEKKKEELDFSVDRRRKTEPIDTGSQRENKFEDIKDIDVEKEEPEYDRVNDNVKPVPRRRKPFAEKMVVCASCSKEKSVHPTLYRENYVCDKCLLKRK